MQSTTIELVIEDDLGKCLLQGPRSELERKIAMARVAKNLTANDKPRKSRERKLTQEKTEYFILGIDRKTGEEAELAKASNSAAALATFQLAKNLGGTTHKDFFIRKISLVVPAADAVI